jgi:hypothetical protein
LVFVRYINEIRRGLESLTGRAVFDPTIYYFYDIPTIVHPLTVTWIVSGAIAIAVLASVLPALRAALLHPVHAGSPSSFGRPRGSARGAKLRAWTRSLARFVGRARRHEELSQGSHRDPRAAGRRLGGARP